MPMQYCPSCGTKLTVGDYRDTLPIEALRSKRKPKRKLSAWNKYVKANSKKPRFRYRNGKLNLKKMAVSFRKTSKRGGKR